MAAEAEPFVWSDAWLLLALIYSREPADFDRLDGICDFINHARITPEEFEGGLRRLVAAGHVLQVADGNWRHGRWAAAPPVFAWYERVSATRSRVHKDMERVKQFLRIPLDH